MRFLLTFIFWWMIDLSPIIDAFETFCFEQTDKQMKEEIFPKSFLVGNFHNTKSV